MPQLTTIDAEDCNLTGTLPSSIAAQLPNMEIFQLNNNSLTGNSQAWFVRDLCQVQGYDKPQVQAQRRVLGNGMSVSHRQPPCSC